MKFVRVCEVLEGNVEEEGELLGGPQVQWLHDLRERRGGGNITDLLLMK
jgi:hypothetical protein